MSDNLITIKTYSFAHEAELDRSLLESHGIPAFVVDEVAGTAAPFITGGVRLQVKSSDFSKSKKLLQPEVITEPPVRRDLAYISHKIIGYITLVFVIVYIIQAIRSFF